MNDGNDSGAAVINLLDELGDRGKLDTMLERLADRDDLDRILDELDGSATVLLDLNLEAAGRAADTLAETNALTGDELRDAIDAARDVADRLEAAAETAARRLDDTTDTE